MLVRPRDNDVVRPLRLSPKHPFVTTQVESNAYVAIGPHHGVHRVFADRHPAKGMHPTPLSTCGILDSHPVLPAVVIVPRSGAAAPKGK